MPVVHKLDQLPEGLNAGGRDIEGMLVIDLTYSMTGMTRKGGRQTRISLAEAVAKALAKRGAEFDSQAEAEAEAGVQEGEDTAGGMRTIGYGTTDSDTDPKEDAWDFGDLNEENFERQWARVLKKLHGRFTVILPGLLKAFEVFKAEHGKKPINERPIAGIVFVIDGEAEDAEQVAAEAEKLRGDVRTVFVVIGYGDEHDRAVAAFESHAAKNDNMVLIALAGEQDPEVVADALAQLLGMVEDAA